MIPTFYLFILLMNSPVTYGWKVVPFFNGDACRFVENMIKHTDAALDNHVSNKPMDARCVPTGAN